MILEEAILALGRRLGSDSTNTTVQARFVDAMEEALKEMFRRCKFVAMKETATLIQLQILICIIWIQERYPFWISKKRKMIAN